MFVELGLLGKGGLMFILSGPDCFLTSLLVWKLLRFVDALGLLHSKKDIISFLTTSEGLIVSDLIVSAKREEIGLF